ncbi:MAG: EF-P beta-lysylation protein EpmB [Thiothrix sp.]|nr:MAG: EF-P beta-lysylation protein EpmB [Thiothrix sp.]
MIPRIVTKEKTPRWQQTLADAITDPVELLSELNLAPALADRIFAANEQFKLKVTRSYLSRMRKADPHDPLLLQILPLQTETLPQPADYSNDPVGDGLASPAPGLIHKYHGRVLLIATGACAIHCRFCFRRHFPYSDTRPLHSAALDYISSDTSIDEVILSGGDPLMLSDQKLAGICQQLANISHVKRLRIHTRLPVVLPERITNTMLDWMTQTRLQIILVVHSNHPQELDQNVANRLKYMADAGIKLFNQSVLLKGINDQVSVLEALCRELFTVGVQPYYLHLLDKVSGAAHFEVEHSIAVKIHAELGTRLPGYMLPRLVREEAGRAAKTIISTN